VYQQIENASFSRIFATWEGRWQKNTGETPILKGFSSIISGPSATGRHRPRSMPPRAACHRIAKAARQKNNV